MTLPIYTSAAFTNSAGVAVAANASVEVRRESDGSLVPIFEDRDGENQITQPGFQADLDGRFQFYAESDAEGWEITVTAGTDTHTLNSQFPQGGVFGIPEGEEAEWQSQAQGRVDAHAAETGGVHGVPVGERALHTGETVGTGDVVLESALTVATTPIGVFRKSDSTKVAWTKTGNDTAETNQDLTVFVGGDVVSVPSGTSIAMPTTLVAGTDYAIWCAPDGTLEADESYSVAPTTGGRRVGGFHYAPGGNASFAINAGDGDTTPQINEYSFHDLKWKPAAPDPRGLTLVGDGAFWCGIYHLVQDHLAGPPHRHGVSPARDGNAPQLITGVGNYPNAQPMNIFEVLAYHGLRSPRVEDFQLLAFGTNEEASRGSDPVTTGLPGGNTDAQFTSHWGAIQSTGVISHWSNDSILSTADQTLPNPSRGGRFRVTHFAALGGRWADGAFSGSRRVATFTATSSDTRLGGRGVCSHVIID